MNQFLGPLPGPFDRGPPQKWPKNCMIHTNKILRWPRRIVPLYYTLILYNLFSQNLKSTTQNSTMVPSCILFQNDPLTPSLCLKFSTCPPPTPLCSSDGFIFELNLLLITYIQVAVRMGKNGRASANCKVASTTGMWYLIQLVFIFISKFRIKSMIQYITMYKTVNILILITAIPRTH